jgi:site-specific DNA-methyltransferase (adenine-specific)
MGSGSTIAACAAMGQRSIGVEIDSDYFHMANEAIPRLAALPIDEGAANGKKGPSRE